MRALAIAAAAAAMSTSGATPESVSIPLKVIDVPGIGWKVGIEVSLGGGAPKLYTFDTGSSGHYAAYNAAWWPTYDPSGSTIHQSYGSDENFEAERVRTTVGFATSHGPIEVKADVGRITNAYSTKPNAPPSTWLADVAAGKPPLYGTFFGDFGSGLRELNGMFAVLPQLPGNLSSGFAVELGCGVGGGSAPRVVVGLTSAIRSRVTSWLTMQGVSSTHFPNSSNPTYAQSLFTGNFSLAKDATSYGFSVNAILDTGGGTTGIHQQDGQVTIPGALLSPGAPTHVVSGAQFRVTAPGTTPTNGFDMAFLTGNTPTLDQVLVAPPVSPSAKPEVNLGLVPFFRYDVVFDIQRGLVGFAPCSAAAAPVAAPIPALSTWAMALLAAALGLSAVLAAASSKRRGRRRDVA